MKNWFTGKDPDAGKHWRQEEKGMTEDKMVGWHHLLNGNEFEQAPEISDGQGSLACMGLQRVKHDWATELYSLISCTPSVKSQTTLSITYHLSTLCRGRIPQWPYCSSLWSLQITVWSVTVDEHREILPIAHSKVVRFDHMRNTLKKSCFATLF